MDDRMAQRGASADLWKEGGNRPSGTGCWTRHCDSNLEESGRWGRRIVLEYSSGGERIRAYTYVLGLEAMSLRKPLIVGRSTVPTRYRVRMTSGEDYVMCGADILLTGIRNDLEGYAQCPVCERPVSFKLDKQRVRNLQPLGALLHVVEIPTEGGRLSVLCSASHIFDREECLRDWMQGYKGEEGGVYSLQGYIDYQLNMTDEPAAN